jgi:hypothetical protein
MVAVVTYRAERWAAPEPARLAMCLRLNAASIAVPSGDRLMYSSDEGSKHG